MERICVTGAGGYVASWVVKNLLDNGFFVHGTVRDPSDEKKNGHLKKLENAEERLRLFKADLFDSEGLYAAISGCTGVFHVASPVADPRFPVSNPEAELLEPAITGTKNVLNACLKANVKKVVIVSSVAAIMYTPNWPKDQVMDESCWTDAEFCKTTEQWYALSKTLAEREAQDFAKTSGLNIVTINPSIVIGPMLQSTLNTSSLLVLLFVKGFPGSESLRDPMEDMDRHVVDVRDLADAILLVYKKPEAEGRYICSPYQLTQKAFVEKLKSIFPDFDYPKNFVPAKQGSSPSVSSQKLVSLGWKYRLLEESLVDSVKNLEEVGLLGDATGQ